MTFFWANVSKRLARELAQEAGLKVAHATRELTAKYGEPPTDAFVRDLWPLLRDRWLEMRPGICALVVADLRNAGLGDGSINVSTKVGRRAYLQSCRLSKRLTAIVLAAFVDEKRLMNHRSTKVAGSPGESEGQPAAVDSSAKPVRKGGSLRLVASGQVGAVERDEALYMLACRAVLTRTVCQELRESGGNFGGRRPRIALDMLLDWIAENYPNSVYIEPNSDDGIDEMVVPKECQELLGEIRDGAIVGSALFMLRTADKSYEAEEDCKNIQEKLNAYWQAHDSAVNVPWN